MSGRLRLSFLLLSVGAVEGTDGEVKKHESDGGVDEKALVGGPSVPTGAQAIDALNKEKAEDCKEEPGDFKPEDAAGVDKRSPDGFAESFGSGLYSRGDVLGSCGVNWRILLDGLGGLGGTIAQHTGSDAHTDAQFAAYAIRLHKENFSSETGSILIAGPLHHK